MRSRTLSFLLLVILLAAAATNLFAQADLAVLVGSVADQKGALVPDATVVATNLATGVSLRAKTNAEGHYRLPNLKFGMYRVEVSRSGFKTVARNEVQLNVGQTLRLDFSLELGAVSESVTVTSDAPLLQTDTSNLSTVISTAQFHQLPLQVSGDRRSPEMFMYLAPGVTGSTGSLGSGAPNVGYFQINGGPSNSSEVLLDGASARAANIYGDFQSFTPSADAIGEFRLLTNSYSAEYGRTGGGITSFSIKSGTNDFHGSAFEFFRNDKLDARGFFQSTTPKTRQNEYGLTIGGPVLIPKLYNGTNKTFFFGTFSGFRNRPGPPQTLLTLPTEAMRNGDFSRVTDSSGNVIPIYDPASTQSDLANPSLITRTPFAGNLIPKSRMSKVALNTVPLLPSLTYPDRLNFNTLAAGGAVADRDTYTIKLDHNFSPRSMLSGSFNRVLHDYITAAPLLAMPFTQNAHAVPKTILFRLSHNYTISPTLVNHAGFSINRWRTLTTGMSYGTDQWPQKIGLTGVEQNFFPTFNFSTDGLQQLAASFGTRGGFTSYLYNDTVSWIHNRHSLKFGFDFRMEGLNEHNFANSSGTFTFHRRETGLPSITNSGQAFASFLVGAVDSGSLRLPSSLETRYHYYALFVQDDFRVSSRLTLNLGLRWEVQQPPTEAQDRQSSLDPALANPGAGGFPGALVFAGSGQGRTGRRTFADTWFGGFGPRVGFAYQLTQKTALRGGYGISYLPGTLNGGGGGSIPNTQGFTASPSFSTADQGITPAFYIDGGFPQNFARPPFLNPSFANAQGITFIPRDNGRLPYMQNWSFNVQRELPAEMLLDVAYSASKGTRLLADNIFSLNQLNPQYLSLGSLLNANILSAQAVAANIKQPFAGFATLLGSRATVGQSLRPFPQFTGVTYFQPPAGNSTYHSLQAKFEKRFSKGLLFLASYTWAKTLTDTGANGQTFLEQSGQDNYNRRLEKSLSPNDIPHVFAYSAVYELPFGPGKAFLNQRGALGKLVGGWQISGVLRYQSGIPLGVGVNNTSGLFNPTLRPNRVLGQPVSLSFSDPAKDRYANVNAFSVPTPFSLGNSSRVVGDLRGPGYYNEDVALWKDTKLGERVRVQLRGEAFNVFNRVVFAAPSLNLSNTTQFGIISGQDNRPRQMQLSLRLEF